MNYTFIILMIVIKIGISTNNKHKSVHVELWAWLITFVCCATPEPMAKIIEACKFSWLTVWRDGTKAIGQQPADQLSHSGSAGQKTSYIWGCG